jgi:hypothetical protein
MQTSERDRGWLGNRIIPVGLWLAAALAGGLWFLLAADSAVYGVPALAAAVIVALLQRRNRARARIRSRVLDTYAAREIARAAAPHRNAA